MFLAKIVGDFNKKGIWKSCIYWLRDSERSLNLKGGNSKREMFFDNITMIKNYDSKITILLRNPEKIVYPVDIQEGIQTSWTNFIKNKNPKDFFNGNIYLVTSIEETANSLIINVGCSKYADLIFAKTTNRLSVKSLFVASYIVTDSGDVVVIKNRRNRINTIGGMADTLDFENGYFNSFKCLSREWKEELGIVLNDRETKFIAVPKYIKLPNAEENYNSVFPVGILYEVKTTLSVAELKELFICNADNTDGEVIDLMVYNKDSFSTLLNNSNSEPYLYELFQNHFNLV